MRNERPLYAWDTNVWIAWLKEESSPHLAQIESLLGDIEAEKAMLLVSSIVLFEVSAMHHTQEKVSTLKAFLRRPSIVQADVTPQIAWKAGEIRDGVIAASRSKSETKKLMRNDAIVIATAVVYGADVLHTVEEKMRKLSESPAVSGLRITFPQNITGQKVMPLADQPDKGSGDAPKAR